MKGSDSKRDKDQTGAFAGFCPERIRFRPTDVCVSVLRVTTRYIPVKIMPDVFVLLQNAIKVTDAAVQAEKKKKKKKCTS